MAIKLGQFYTDSISGFKGVATSRTEYIHGCARIGITPRELRDGKPVETQVFDELQLIEYVAEPGEVKKGGPGLVASRQSIPAQR